MTNNDIKRCNNGAECRPVADVRNNEQSRIIEDEALALLYRRYFQRYKMCVINVRKGDCLQRYINDSDAPVPENDGVKIANMTKIYLLLQM